MSNTKNTRIAIHGSCVSRDLFEFDKAGMFSVCEYIARNSIVSALAPAYEAGAELYRPGDWQKRMVQIDCSKTLFDHLENSGAEFLLLDLIDERFPLNMAGETCITWSGGAQKYLPSLPAKTMHASKYPRKRLKELAAGYCRRILSGFRPSQIILYRAKFLEQYLDKEGNLVSFPQDKIPYYRTLNTHIIYLMEIMEDFFGGVHILDLPENAVSYEGHKWGLAPMHYDPLTYETVLNEIKKIVRDSLC